MWITSIKVHTELSNMQNFKPKQKQYSFVSFLAGKSTTSSSSLYWRKSRCYKKKSITYLFTMARSYMIIRFLTFIDVNIFFFKVYVTVKTMDKFQYPLILSFPLCKSQMLNFSVLNWNVAWSMKLASLLRVGQTQRFKSGFIWNLQELQWIPKPNWSRKPSSHSDRYQISSEWWISPNFSLPFPWCPCLKFHHNWVKNLIYPIWIWE